MKSTNFKKCLIAIVVILVAIAVAVGAFLGRPEDESEIDASYGTDVSNESLPDLFDEGSVATENIYPKLISPEKRLLPGYQDFVEAPGALPGEVVLLAPCGVEIGSLYEGIVSEAESSGRWNGGYGNFIRLDILGGDKVYAHLDKVFVAEGDVVRKGDFLGTAGRTGSLPENQPCLFGVLE